MEWFRLVEGHKLHRQQLWEMTYNPFSAQIITVAQIGASIPSWHGQRNRADGMRQAPWTHRIPIPFA
jgi:hypothetical protein